LTWNNAPLAQENVSAAWVDPLDSFPGFPGVARQWDVSRAVSEAYASGGPLRLSLYDADWAYHSGKYFVTSDAEEWNEEARPALRVTWGYPQDVLQKTAVPYSGELGDAIDFTLSLSGTGQGLWLTDTLPIGIGAPSDIEIEGSTVMPVYDSVQHSLTWSDAPPPEQDVMIHYRVMITTAEPKVLVNRAQLSDLDRVLATATVRVTANGYKLHLPLVLKGD
jgi:hypothetical protein